MKRWETYGRVNFFTYPSCISCRKTKKWLTANQIDYNERHIFRETPSAKEILKLLSLTTEGLNELLTKRSETYKQLNLDVNELSLSEMVNLLIDEPQLLRRPILTDGRKLVIGYNTEALKGMTAN